MLGVIREGVLGLEPADLQREVLDLAARNVRRVDRDHVHASSESTGQGFEQITPVKGGVLQKESLGIGPGLPHGLGGQIASVDVGLRDGVGHRQGHRADARGEIDSDRLPTPPEPPDGLLRQKLARLPRHERSRTDGDAQAPEVSQRGGEHSTSFLDDMDGRLPSLAAAVAAA